MNESEWLTVEQVMDFERISRVEAYRRMQPGDCHALIWKNREDGKPGRVIDPTSLSPDAKDRWVRSKLQDVANAAQIVKVGTSLQESFFPELDRDKAEIATLPSEYRREEVFRKLSVVQISNGDFAARGFSGRTAFMKSLVKVTGVSVRTQRRWNTRYEAGGLAALVDKRPGPEKGTGEVLESWEKAYLDEWWLRGRTKSQCLHDLNKVRATKKASRAGYSYNYCPRARSTVERYLRNLDAIRQSAREGPDALKAVCGHIDRSYVDLASLERVESDECKLNLFSYDPHRCVNRRGEPWIRRYWLLTFYDARSMYPVVWGLCEGSEYELRHGIAVQDEINLFVELVRGFGIPRAIHSDRGRFRGKVWGGEPYQQHIDKEFAPANGILQRVGQLVGYESGIRHDMPRVHNPRGTRLERFHKWVADWFRGKPGWIGANTRERKMTHGDADAEKHKQWCVGKLSPGAASPLLTKDAVLAEVNKMMEAWREHNSEGTDMNGLTPRAVFVQCAPASGFPRISEEQLALATAQHFENERIETGGIIELRDGSRYSHPLLIPLAGQKREVARLRHDHSFVIVLPAQKGAESIKAPRNKPVGANDPDNLARKMESLNRVNKIAGAIVKPLEYDPGAQFEDASAAPEPPKTQVIRPAEFVTEQADLAPGTEIGSVEFLMEKDRYKHRVKPMTFADLEY
jgi:hypothetical protein